MEKIFSSYTGNADVAGFPQGDDHSKILAPQREQESSIEADDVQVLLYSNTEILERICWPAFLSQKARG